MAYITKSSNMRPQNTIVIVTWTALCSIKTQKRCQRILFLPQTSSRKSLVIWLETNSFIASWLLITSRKLKFLSNIMLQSLYCFFESECKKPKSSLYTTIQSTYISAVILHICWYVLYSKRDSYSQARTCKETPVWLDISVLTRSPLIRVISKNRWSLPHPQMFQSFLYCINAWLNYIFRTYFYLDLIIYHNPLAFNANNPS